MTRTQDTQTAEKEDWVEIHRVILKPEERAPNIPEETRRVPLELRVKGWLQDTSAVVGSEVTIRTATGRELKGTLRNVHPAHTHGFGEPVPELLMIGAELRALLGTAAEDAQ